MKTALLRLYTVIVNVRICSLRGILVYILFTRRSQIFGVMEPMKRLTIIYGAPQ